MKATSKITPNGYDMLYNKRLGFATVYGNEKNGLSAAGGGVGGGLGFQDRGYDQIYSYQAHMSHMKKSMHHGSRPPWATY